MMELIGFMLRTDVLISVRGEDSDSFVLPFEVFLVEGFLGRAENSRCPSSKELGTGLEGV